MTKDKQMEPLIYDWDEFDDTPEAMDKIFELLQPLLKDVLSVLKGHSSDFSDMVVDICKPSGASVSREYMIQLLATSSLRLIKDYDDEEYAAYIETDSGDHAIQFVLCYWREACEHIYNTYGVNPDLFDEKVEKISQGTPAKASQLEQLLDQHLR